MTRSKSWCQHSLSPGLLCFPTELMGAQHPGLAEIPPPQPRACSLWAGQTCPHGLGEPQMQGVSAMRHEGAERHP